MQRVRNASAASLMPFVEESVEPGSVVHTDGWLGYEPLGEEGLPASHRLSVGPPQAGLGIIAEGAPSDLVAQALAAGHAPRRG